jgi:hypothetical protein
VCVQNRNHSYHCCGRRSVRERRARGAAGQRGQTHKNRSNYAGSRATSCRFAARADPTGSRQNPRHLHPYLQCPSTCVRPIQPLASGALSINPPLTLSSLPSPPRNTQRRTSPLHFSFPRPAVHLSPPLLLSGSAAHLSPPFLLHWAGGAPPPSSSSPVWCRSLDNAGSWGAVVSTRGS